LNQHHHQRPEGHLEYVLRLADNPLLLGQRCAELVGKAPQLEEEMALANIGLDLLGQARLLLARVHGIATAAGCQLVATCDLAVAAEDARFATPGVNIGLFCSTPMVALSRNVPRKQAMEMLLLGELVDAATAKGLGLVNRVVPPGDLDAEVARIAGTIVAKSPLTLRIGKEAFYRQLERPVAEAYEYASRVMTDNMLARDAEEGIDAFLGKRAPVWEGT
jgi:enoyl-CoA hydratase/carnithine racemase